MTRARVFLEEGERRVFAVSLDWPGWCRRGRTVDDALDTLDAYRGRYGNVVGADFAPGPLEVIGTVVEDEIPVVTSYSTAPSGAALAGVHEI